MIKLKKAEITTSQLISIILLIATIAILFFFYYYFDWKENINDEICHQSIVERSTFNVGPIEIGKNIPLKCETKKYYLYSDKNNIGFVEKDSKRIKLDKNSDNSKNEIIELVSEEIYNSHSIVGQGKLDFMPHSFSEKNYCLILSKFSFQEEVMVDLGNIKYSDIFGYMKNKKDSENNNYYDFVYEGTDLDSLIMASSESSSDQENILLSSPFSNEFSDYVLIVQMMPESTMLAWLKAATGGIAAGGIPLVASQLIFGTTPIGFSLNVFGAVALLIYSDNHPASRDCEGERCNFNYIPPAIVPFNSEILTKIGCYDFSVAP